MYYTVYKVTNKISGKFYIGTHKTKNLDDEYMGSGKYLKRSIEKHGLENFEKEILFIFDNPEDMFAKEAEIVNEDFLAEENTYNLKIGGFGGWDYVNTNEKLRVAKNKKAIRVTQTRYSREVRSEWAKKSYKPASDPNVYRIGGKAGNDVIREKYPKGTFKGKSHSEETKKVISQKAKDRLKDPTKNGMYGKQWFHNPTTKKNVVCLPEDAARLDLVKGRYKSAV